jgi:GalNAc-alpha-(1->4)-GalNAc-alpha-(1->3)-diNAcBac-PP-undecaprenol alpha-1,4-N-acetyl-D-galactosaminyltransferase
MPLATAARLTLVIGSLGPGGAERNLLRLAEGLSLDGFTVTVLTLNPLVPDFYPLPPCVLRAHPHHDVATSPRWFDLAGQMGQRRALADSLMETRPDLVISFIDTCNIQVLAAIGSGPVPVIVSERIDWRYHSLNWRWHLMRRWLYPKAARVVSLAREPELSARGYWPRWRSCHISNPVPVITDNNIEHPPWFGRYNLVGMGRLVEQKGFDMLLEAFAMLAVKRPDWHLTILGDGPLRGALETQAQQLNLSDKVHLPGNISPPFPIVKAADLFVFSSRYEAFGMALAEAMACGMPVVSFDCPSGPADIVRDGIDGYLVPPNDVAALAAAMDQLMGNDSLRHSLAARAKEVTSRFSPERILGQWRDLVNQVLKERAAAS